MRADNQVRFAGRELIEHLTPLGRGQRTGQHPDPHAALAQVALQGRGVLPRQNLGRRHQRRLIAVGHGHQHRVFGHHRLAAADVALQQAVHGRGPRQVRGDLLDGLVLCRRQVEREQAADPRVDLAIGDQRRSPARLRPLLFPQGQRQLQDQQFLIDEPAAGLRQARRIPGRVDLGHRRLDRQQRVRGQVLVRKHFVQQSGVGIDRRTYEAPQVRLLQALGQRIQGQNAPGLDRRSPSSSSTRGWTISHRPPLNRGVPDNNTRDPRRNRSRI